MVGLIALLLALAGAPVEASPAEASAAPALPPESILRTYRYSREDEDWRWLARGATESDRFDSIKYRPILDGRGSLSLGGEVQARVERIENEAWGLRSRDPNEYALFRARFHADFRLGETFRVFAQLQAADLVDRDGGPRPSIDRDALGVQQLFAEFAFSERSALRVGRQELSFGLGRLISIRAGPINVRQPQDGLRFIARRGDWRADVFAMRVVETRPDAFDDSSSDGADLFGVYLTRGQPYVSPRGLELYLFRFDRDLAAYFSRAGPEERATLGTRAWIRGGAWEHDAELAYQFGTFGRGAREGDIAAWAFATRSTYTFESPWRPVVELNTGFNSGDENRGDDDLADPDIETFVAPLPRGGYFGEFAPFGPGNLGGARLALTVHPRADLAVTAGVYGFWRQSTSDGLYGVSGFPLLPPVGEERHVGVQSELGLDLRIDRHLELALDVAHFRVGDALRDAGAREEIVSAAATLRYVF